MNSLSVPVMLMASTYNRKDILADLREAKANRVLLALDYLTYDAERMKAVYERLREEIPAYQKEGFEVGVWFWTFLVQGNPPFQPMQDAENGNFGSVNGDTARACCPLGEGYLRFMERHLQTVAAMHPDLILYDDDFSFRLSSGASSHACFCPLHRAKMEEILGEPLPKVPNLYNTMYEGKPNRLRSAFLKACGDSLIEFSARMRRAVDAVDPSVRMGQCAIMNGFDADGTDSFTISKILAGNTKPFLRLIGAPYWAAGKNLGRLNEVIERERMERSWYDGDDIEIVSEGDVYPRPRYRCPASYLELFDAALRADGNFNGIMKYMADYTSSAAYERGYFEHHRKHLPDLEAMSEDFAPLDQTGVRIWETMRKLENADFSREPNGGELARQQLFSRVTRLTAHNSIPTTYYGIGCGGICFGENARKLTTDALEKPLILDAVAARILSERGIDTGVEAFGDRFAPENERFTETGEVICCYSGDNAFAERLTPKAGAVVKSEWSGEKSPASFTYRSAEGQTFLVLAVNSFGSTPAYFENYERQRQIFDFFAENGTPVPAVCRKNPNLYVICKANADRMAIGLFNSFADEIDDLTVDLADEWTTAAFHRCEGRLEGKRVTVGHLSAFEWCWLTLSR